MGFIKCPCFLGNRLYASKYHKVSVYQYMGEEESFSDSKGNQIYLLLNSRYPRLCNVRQTLPIIKVKDHQHGSYDLEKGHF